MRIYQMENEEVAAFLNGDLVDGLTVQSDRKKADPFKAGTLFLRGFFGFLKEKFYYLNILCLVCYLIAGIFSWLNQSWDLFSYTVIALILTLVLYFAEGIALYCLKKKYNDRNVGVQQKVRVIRCGNKTEILPEELVVGDLLCLEAGSVLYCDARIVKNKGLYADESTVFGATIPAEKQDTPILADNLSPNDQRNMLWKGSYISSGTGYAMVCALENDCYIEKTGGRKRRKQRSFFYNKQNNIGRIASYVYSILLCVLLLTGVIFTTRYVETFLTVGALASLVVFNPISSLMEWSYYRTAAGFYQNGILIRNIEAFDGMNKEKNLYFNASALVDKQMRYSHTIDLMGTEKSTVSYFSLCMGSRYFTRELQPVLQRYQLSYEDLERRFPVFRREKDACGNVFSLFSNEGSSVVVATGYWKEMLPLIRTVDDALLREIEELEIHGKMVYAMCSDSMNYIPNKLDLSIFDHHMDLTSFVVFDLPVSKKVLSMIGQLRHAAMKVYLISRYSEPLSRYLADAYDMDSVVTELPQTASYSLPGFGNPAPIVYETSSSPIERERSMVILKEGSAPQTLIYKVKCMFCGIRRCLNFLAISGVFLVLTVLTMTLAGINVAKLIFPLLLLLPVLVVPCYYLIESVRNCNQYRRSLILGMFCGSAGLVSALISCDMAIFSFGLSTVLLSLYFVLSGAKQRPISRKDVVFLAAALILVLIPLFFTGGTWLPAVLLAVFPPLGAFILDLFY